MNVDTNATSVAELVSELFGCAAAAAAALTFLGAVQHLELRLRHTATVHKVSDTETKFPQLIFCPLARNESAVPCRAARTHDDGVHTLAIHVENCTKVECCLSSLSVVYVHSKVVTSTGHWNVFPDFAVETVFSFPSDGGHWW
jgi:hypothetical protein